MKRLIYFKINGVIVGFMNDSIMEHIDIYLPYYEDEDSDEWDDYNIPYERVCVIKREIENAIKINQNDIGKVYCGYYELEEGVSKDEEANGCRKIICLLEELLNIIVRALDILEMNPCCKLTVSQLR